jgi:cobalt-zinc-cadmium efflux system outer membrane protein
MEHPAQISGSVTAALSQRAEIDVEEARLASLRQQGRLIHADGRPDLALSGRLESFTSEPRLGGVALEITLPFLDYGSRRNRVSQARSLNEAQAAQLDVVRTQVRQEVQHAVSRLQSAERLVRSFQEGLLDHARRLAEAERIRFQTGAGSPLTVLEAQRTYRSVLGDYYAALAAHAQARAELEWATGSGPAFPDDSRRPSGQAAPGARPEAR